ncbi:MAG: shikimate kinase [Deltaproteobacteria bacterium]|nr:shikimate kinase [Deltaproteobacteria bacterium]MBW2071465.1 shikimate kinase [Deltaproteobacteria bacterium]
MNIVLIGYRCSGKTSVGRLLADRLRRTFLDTDVLIEQKCGRSIQAIVAEQGWDHFRRLESEVVEDLGSRDNLVVATGGGVVTRPQNVAALRRHSRLVWLKADAATLLQRMTADDRQTSTRPPLLGDDSSTEIETVLAQRTPLYEKAAHLIVDSSGLSIPQVVEAIITALPRMLEAEQPSAKAAGPAAGQTGCGRQESLAAGSDADAQRKRQAGLQTLQFPACCFSHQCFACYYPGGFYYCSRPEPPT